MLDSFDDSPPQEFPYHKPHGVVKDITFKADCFIGLIEDGLTVLKYPRYPNSEGKELVRQEAERYIFLGTHENVVGFKALSDDGLLLEYCHRGKLEDIIDTLTTDQKARIGEQIIRGLVHLHAKNYIHCDLNARNIFITSGMNARIGDMQGQLHRSDGTVDIPALTIENPKSRHPEAGDDECSPRTDVFALGTLLYYVWHGNPPFLELNEHRDEVQIREKFRRWDYPADISSKATGIDKIIWKCWFSAYHQASEVLDDIMAMAQNPSGA